MCHFSTSNVTSYVTLCTHIVTHTQVDLPRNPHTPWGVIRDWLKQAQQLQFGDPAKQVTNKLIDMCACVTWFVC